ncbi:MAG: HpcH/HpaI aldolase family protein, partial [Ilumatobacteraceae bacterium]
MTQRDTLRTKWDRSEETLGAWTFIPSPVTAESCARAGFDYVCIDTQHGAIGYDSVVPMVQAIELGGGIPIARVPWNEPGIIGKMLDAGCHGIIIPMVNTAEEARAAVRASRYAPLGSRSWGPAVSAPRHGDYRVWADAHIAVIPMIETVEALNNVDDIL